MESATALASPPPLPPPQPTYETSDRNDYIVGALFVTSGGIIAFLLGWAYWQLHGGSLDTFAFWTSGDKRWLEALFWSFFTVHAWNVTDVGYQIADRHFKKRYVWGYLARTLEAPPISLALVFILMNLGVTFGDAKVSLQEAPVHVVIAIAIISAYFSGNAVAALAPVADWFGRVVKGNLKGGSRKK